MNFPTLKPAQHQTIECVRKKRDCLAVLPTGYGKSLCYQVPASWQEGLVIVISPLIALMQDQVQSAEQKGLRAVFWHGELSPFEKNQLWKSIYSYEYNLLFISPESLQKMIKRPQWRSLNVHLIAVDEAHCIVKWGGSFRPEYSLIDPIIKTLEKRPPILAVTATAGPTTRKKITESLCLLNPLTVLTSTARPELSLVTEWVDCEVDKRKRILHSLRWWQESQQGRVILFAGTRRSSENYASWLNEQGFPWTDYFHAGLSVDERQNKLLTFRRNPRGILVGTTAIGMGVDLPAVRLVLHCSAPLSIEDYLQEVGRAGRDGIASWAFLPYLRSDVTKTIEQRMKKLTKVEQKMLWQEVRQFDRFVMGNSCLGKAIQKALVPSIPWSDQSLCSCNRCQPLLPWDNQKTDKPTDAKLWQALRVQRDVLAKQLTIPPYMLGDDSMLTAIASERPVTWTSLRLVSGMGHRRAYYWGKQILRLCQASRKEIPM